MVVEESFSLYHFHPIFEFFLTFYTAYLISDDLKKLLDKKFFDLIKTKFIDIIRSNKTLTIGYLDETIKAINEKFPTKEQSDAKSNEIEVGFQQNKKEKLSELETLRKSIDDHFSENKDSQVIADLSITKNLKPFFLFYSLYCFFMLIICGFVSFPLVSIKSLNAGIVVFNSAAMVFTILPVVIPAIRKRPLPSQAPVGLFLFFIFLGFGCYYWLWMYKIFANSPLCAITFSVILAAIPLLILVFTSITVSPETISSICEQIKRGFEAKIHLIEDNISNFNEKTKAVDVAYKQLKEAQEKLLEKKQP